MATAPNLVINPELRKKILFTIAVLAVYRIGVHVPTPGVDGTQVMKFFEAQSGGIFGLFNTFTGGALERFSVFALGIMPYISSSIIFQLLTAVVPSLMALKKEGSQGQKKINQYTRYGTVALAIIQGYGISSFLKNSTSPDQLPLVLSANVGLIPFELMTIITLTAGTCFIMWLGEQITEKGIGNGASLIIFAGIAAQIPSGFTSLVSLVQTGQMVTMGAVLLIAFMFFIVGAIIFLETGERRIPVQYSQRGAGKGMGGQSTYLPLKINFSGVIPPIFASSLLLFPTTITQFSDAPWLLVLRDSLAPNGSLFNLFYIGLIIFFCFFYTEIVFEPKDVSDNLKKYGGFVPGVRAGKSTAEYIMKVLMRVTVAGAIYLALICVLPSILTSTAGVPFYFGGTSLLILVGVALDTVQRIQSYAMTQQYESMTKGKKVRTRRRVQY